MAAKSSSRGGTGIRLVVIHTNEGDNPADVFPDRTAENLAAYLDRPSTQASYHKICDDDSTVRYLPDSVASWSIRSGNSRALNLCLTGWARWTRGQWLDHAGMLRRAAGEVAAWCDRYEIPVRKLTPTQVAADHLGIIGHWDWTLGKRDGTHTDPGPNFPWDVFIELVKTGTAIEPPREPIRGADPVSEIALPRTDPPTDWDSPRSTWPTREEVIHLGWVKGQHGWHTIRLAVGHPGGHLKRAHVDYPNGVGEGATLLWWVNPDEQQSHDVEPPYRADREYVFAPATPGPGVLMITYAAPGGASVNIERER
ncbi:MAG: N-acetylmuramoyl-L-alanine amidase [Pseudonocardiaceae bacterium]